MARLNGLAFSNVDFPEQAGPISTVASGAHVQSPKVAKTWGCLEMVDRPKKNEGENDDKH